MYLSMYNGHPHRILTTDEELYQYTHFYNSIIRLGSRNPSLLGAYIPSIFAYGVSNPQSRNIPDIISNEIAAAMPTEVYSVMKSVFEPVQGGNREWVRVISKRAKSYGRLGMVIHRSGGYVTVALPSTNEVSQWGGVFYRHSTFVEASVERVGDYPQYRIRRVRMLRDREDFFRALNRYREDPQNFRATEQREQREDTDLIVPDDFPPLVDRSLEDLPARTQHSREAQTIANSFNQGQSVDTTEF